ncbi:MAG: hypothetical protein QXO17_07015 [Nitrososphaerota archaeon]|nr:hypothetical protein [Candidatus Calditenuis fumarioli]
MTGLTKGLLAYLSSAVALGSLLSGPTAYPFRDLQQAIVAELYRSLTFYVAPVSSALGDGISLTRYGFTLSTSHGLYPLLGLLIAGLLAGLCAGRSGSVVAPLLGSALVFGLWQLTGFYLLPQLYGQYEWVGVLNGLNEFLLVSKPLELLALFSIPLIGSIPAGHLIDSSAEKPQPLFYRSSRR